MATIWTAGINATAIGLPGGAAISAAIVGASTPSTVKAKYSTDGVTWPSDGSAVTVDTIAAGEPLGLCLIQLTGGEILLTNGDDWFFVSYDLGLTWGVWT